jgi:hypothetical protein
MSNSQAHPSPKTANTLAPKSITRVTLSNGYRAYRRSDDKPTGKQQKRVRFVKGHVTIPDRYSHMDPILSPGLEGEETEGGVSEDGKGNGADELEGNGDGGENAKGFVERKQEDVAEMTDEMEGRQSVEKQTPPDVEQGDNKKRGKLVLINRGGVTVWRKQPRFRGSGTLRVLDDPVRDGLKLARSRAGLPSDRWRDRLDGVVRVKQERVGYGQEKGLRYDDGEREASFGMEDIVREEGGITVRIVRSRRTQREEARGEGRDVEAPQMRGDEAGSDSVALTETGSDSERDDSDEYDFLADVSLEEIDGWIPVMVAEEDEGDDWMSLTGSWVMMGSMAEGSKCHGHARAKG